MKTNKDIGKRISDARKESDITLKELGILVGISESTVQRYESGKIINIEINMVKKFAEALGVSPAYLLGWEIPEYAESVLINVYGSIPAGIPLEAVESTEGQIDIPLCWLKGDKRYIALRVKGDSMYPKYLEGDTVIIQLQPDCESGQDAAVYMNGYEATLKTVIKTNGGVILKPVNPLYPPKTYGNANDIVILGIVKELRRKI